MRGTRSVLTGAALLCTTTIAQHVSQFCPSSDVCYSLNIPEVTAKFGSGDVYMQISGPTSYSWIGLGQGDSMGGANMFLIYTNGEGNVTVSPRLGRDEIEPLHDTYANVSLLAGSGVANGRMVANIICSNCDHWPDGSMDFSTSSASWVHASRPGSPLNTGDLNAGIEQHHDFGVFNWDLTKAQGGANGNPYYGGGGGGGNGGGVSTKPPPPTASGDGGDNDGDGDDDDDDDSGAVDASQMIVSAHGALGSVVVLTLFPAGAIVIRIPGLNRSIWVHVVVQIFAYIGLIATVGLGIYIATLEESLTHAHPIIGILLLAFLFLQPLWGWLHHSTYKKKGVRTTVSHIHIWQGRLAILLGMINGGLGLKIAQQDLDDNNYNIAYIVVATIIGTTYIGVMIYSDLKRSRNSSTRILDQNEERKGQSSPQL